MHCLEVRAGLPLWMFDIGGLLELPWRSKLSGGGQYRGLFMICQVRGLWRLWGNRGVDVDLVTVCSSLFLVPAGIRVSWSEFDRPSDLFEVRVSRSAQALLNSK